MIGFFAELDGDDSVTLQEEELAEAVWFTREEIPVQMNSVSLSLDKSGGVTLESVAPCFRRKIYLHFNWNFHHF